MKTKKLWFLFLFVLIISSDLTGQTAKYPYAGGVGLIKNEYLGDMGDGILNSGYKKFLGAFLYVSKYMGPLLNLTLETSYGDYGFKINNLHKFLMRKYDLTVMADIKPFDYDNLYSSQPLTPIISIGIGMASYDENFKPEENRYTSNPLTADIRKGIDLILPIGAGFKYQLNDYFALQYKYLFNFTNQDIRDLSMGAGNPVYIDRKGNDSFGKHLFSLVFAFGEISYPYLRR